MIVTIHQPLLLPWLGYLDRMLRSDLFILLDHVQFERRNYQNRTRIRFDGEARWFTVPVVQHSREERIIDKRIDNSSCSADRWWGSRHFKTLCHAYRDAPFFDDYAPHLRSILHSRCERLVDLDLALLELVRTALDIRTPIVRSSELGVGGRKSELMLNLCRAVEANVLLGGMGGSREYLDAGAFERAGIEVAWQQFRHPRYPQCGPGPFLPGLSSIDLLANCGPRSRSCLDEQPMAGAGVPATPLGANLCAA
jgi:WbqC-like protein